MSLCPKVCGYHIDMVPAAIPPSPIPWLEPGQPFPAVERAWPASSPAPGLLAAGGQLNATTLMSAYQQGIFPWFNDGEPPLWWSPDPRMVLRPSAFRWHRSLQKSLHQFQQTPAFCIRIDTAFTQVMQACAESPRQGKQVGSWIQADIIRAYSELASAGLAHSVEVWQDEQLLAGLYCVSLGHAVFGESMFTRVNNGSKIALAALVQFCLAQGVEMIDCQQQTQHLAFMGAAPIAREAFCTGLQSATRLAPLPWHDAANDWTHLRFSMP